MKYKIPIKNCGFCETPFAVAGSRHLFCCNKCLQKHLYRKHRLAKRPSELIRAKDKYNRLKDTDVWQYSRYKRGAKQRNISFNLSFEDFVALHGKPCFYCGEENTKNGLDRVDNNMGYFKENIVPACEWCNKAKWIKPQDDFINKCRKIYEVHNKRFRKKTKL